MPPRSKAAGPSLSALKNVLAAKQAAEEEQKRLDEEAGRAAEEAEQARLRMEAEAEAAKEARKERERLKKEEQKKLGKVLTKSEKEKQERNRLKLQQLQSSGNVIIPRLERQEGVQEGEAKKKRPVYADKKKSMPKKEVKPNDGDASKDAAEEGVLDDWEAALGSEEEGQSVQSASEASVHQLSASLAQVHVTEEGEVGRGVQGGEDARKRPVELRSPICCILGHVDTGKTKLLDKIRQTNVQEGEAGGITQQIGATYFPIESVRQKTEHLLKAYEEHRAEDPEKEPAEELFKVPGLLVIDTPGHESFTNLRSRGSSLCNIAILVVDIMHGLEPQTLESLSLLRQRKTPFIVALNKIDRLYGWKSIPGIPLQEAIRKQEASVRNEFEARVSKTMVAFAEQGLNAELFYRNQDVRKCVSMIPTSAITGDGIPDLLFLLIRLTQKMMSESLRYLSTLQCTVLEVKVAEGLGTTIDVILSNGILKEGDRIAITGLNGPIVTTIRALLTPQPLRELRIRSQYVHHRRVKAALGVKICAPDLEKAVPGSQLLVISSPEEEASARERVMEDLTAMLESVDKTGPGVHVQASTLGSLEALLSFLKDSKIPVAGINIGPIHRKDVTKASVMTELAKEYACILAFDVKIERDAEELADELDVRIFRADIIYHLFDQFTKYMNDISEQKKKDLAPSAVFPCALRIVPGCVFNKRSPIIVGVEVAEGSLRVGTPLCVIGPDNQPITLGRVTSIEHEHRPMELVKRGGPSVAIKIECAVYEATRMYGRHFTEKDALLSKITRQSIDVLKEGFRDQVSKEEWALVVKLKKLLNIA